jgi:hypothetical protein
LHESRHFHLNLGDHRLTRVREVLEPEPDPKRREDHRGHATGAGDMMSTKELRSLQSGIEWGWQTVLLIVIRTANAYALCNNAPGAPPHQSAAGSGREGETELAGLDAVNRILT